MNINSLKISNKLSKDREEDKDNEDENDENGENNKIISFWLNSAEYLNLKLRNNEIDLNDLYYLRKILQIEKLIHSNISNSQNVFYRSCVFNIYLNYSKGEILEEKTFQSCFCDKFDNEYGSFDVTIIVPKGNPFFMFNTTIILPPGDYEVIENNKTSCKLKLKKVKKYLI